MDIKPTIVASVFSTLIRSEYAQTEDRTANDLERQVAKKLLKHLQAILDDYTCETDSELFEEDHETAANNDEDEEWKDDQTPKWKAAQHHCDLLQKIKILEMIKSHPNWKLSTIQKKGGAAFKNWNYKKRWESQIKNCGTASDKFHQIEKHVYELYLDARSQFKVLRGSHLKRWALIRASQFDDSNFQFKASDTWLESFKRKHRISSRKITQLVSKREIRDSDKILTSAREFQKEVKQICAQISAEYVLNTDQVGFQYDLTSNRTLSNQGEKITFGVTEVHTNMSNQSYTAQYIISKAGQVTGNVFLCLKEPSGKFGPAVEHNLFKAPNVTVTCSKSGKLSRSLVEVFLDSILLKHVNSIKAESGKFILILDNWSGQTDLNLYKDRFGGDTGQPECVVKFIPEKCTPLCQPLDTTFHRQLKYLAREINIHAALENQNEVYTRNNIIRTQSLLHHQISAPIFKPMIQYSWYSSGLTEDRFVFQNMKQVCFSFKTFQCDQNTATCQQTFIQCSRCRKHLCFKCFFWEYHAPKCTNN